MAIEILRYVAAGSGDTLELLDQRELPRSEVWLSLGNATEVAEAIRSMAVRGAPAIGIVAAFGMALAAKRGERLEEADSVLRASRPTAVNLFWALDRIKGAWGGGYEAILAEARAIHTEDIAMNERMGVHGASLIRDGDGIVTICNTGACHRWPRNGTWRHPNGPRSGQEDPCLQLRDQAPTARAAPDGFRTA